MKKTIRKSLSVLLSLLMLLSALPLSVFAEEWKAAAAQSEEAQTEESEPLQGDLIAAEITVGNTKRTYVRNDAGRMELVSEESTQKRSWFKAPKKAEEPTGWETYTVAQIETAAKWALENDIGTSFLAVNDAKDATVVYGAKGYGSFKDENHDLICDTCGYCLNGCSDGTLKQYTEQDKVTGPDAEGKYYNAQGVWIGTNAKGTYTYNQMDEAGNIVYDENGNPKTVTTEYSYIQYEAYTVGADGKCDVCGKKMCSANGAHSFADGFCDGCGVCMGTHTDVTGGTQDAPDGKCDICGQDSSHVCVDANNDGKCDTCGKDASHTYTDDIGGTQDAPDGKCDVCGYCTGTCADGNNDGKCDVCGKDYYASCAHSDNYGSATCTVCKTTCKHQTIGNLQQISASLSAMQAALLAKREAGETVDADFLDKTLAAVLQQTEGDTTSLPAVLEMRAEFNTVKSTEDAFLKFAADMQKLTAADVTAEALVGKFVTVEGVRSLDTSGSLFDMLDKQKAQYEEAYANVKYGATKAYFKAYATYEQKYNTAKEALNALAGELFDAALKTLYGSVTPQRFRIDAGNRNTVRSNMRAVENAETLLLKLYGTAYTDASYQTTATQVWNGQSADLSNAQTRRAVGFAMLENVRREINALREAAFTGFQQTTYDSQGYYAKREAMADDMLRKEGNDADTYTVTDETIKTMVQQIDGFAASPEAVAMIKKILPDTFGVDIRDYDDNGIVTMFDLLMSVLMQKVLDNDTINTMFSMVFPTVTGLIDDLPELLTQNDLLRKLDNDTLRIDIVNAITLAAGGSASLGSTLTDILDVIGLGGSLDVDINGGRATELKKLLGDAGFSFWPSQIAKLLKSVNESKYSSIISKLNGCGDNWKQLLNEEDKLDFDWNLSSFDDFKGILSVLFGAINPLLEMLFATKIQQYDKIKMDKAIYFSVLIQLILVAIPLASDGSFNFYPGEFHYYEDIIVPIFEALGVNDFAPSDGSTVPTYQFRQIKFTSQDAAANARVAVDALMDPLMTLLKQFATHPIEKLLSILPNLTLMMQNGKLTELLDLNSSYSLFISTSFNTNSASSFFSGLGDIIENQIMKHWYDWLNPVKYVQLVTTSIAYMMFQPLAAMLMGFLSLIDINLLARFNIVNLSKPVNSLMSDVVLPEVGPLLEKVVGLLDFGLKPGATDFNWPKDVEIDTAQLVADLNFSELLAKFFTPDALGFDPNKLSSVVQWFLENLTDADGNEVYLLDRNLLNENALDELSSLGQLKKKENSIRDGNYRKHWNSLRTGEYYHVNADISDVFYFCVKLISGVLTDKRAVTGILKLLGLDYNDVKAALAKITQEGTDVLGLQASDLLKNACDDNGNLDLDKLLSSLTTDNLLVVMSEMLVPKNTYADTLTYPDAPDTTKQDIADNGGKIPYLEYDNNWTTEMATFVTDDLDDFLDALLQEIPYDLNPSTEKIETLREFARPLLEKYLNEPAYLTLLVELLSGVYDETLALPADLVKDATGIDISGWTNDFAYLFDSLAAAPQTKAFPRLEGTRTGTAENGDPIVEWKLDGKKVSTYTDILNALGVLLAPARPLFSMLFTGDDFKVMKYTRDGQPAGQLVTIKGNDGYNDCLLPLLEAMGIDAPSAEEFKAIGDTSAGLLHLLNMILDHLFEIFESPTVLADLLEMAAQVMYALSGEGVSTLTKNFLHPLWVMLDTLRPILNIDLDKLVNTLLCRFTYTIGKYNSAKEMQQVLASQGAELSLKNLTVNRLLSVLSVIASVPTKDGKRLYLDVKQPYFAAITDLAVLREEYQSKAVDADGERRTAYRLNVNGSDALTVMASMGMEVLMYHNNADVIDAVLDRMLSLKGVVKTLVELMNGLTATYRTDFNWAYILGENATAAEKAALLAQIQQDGFVPVAAKRTLSAQKDFGKYLDSYTMTDWDEDTAVWLAERMDDMLTNALNIDAGDGKLLGNLLLDLLDIRSDKDSFTLGSFAMEAVNGLFTDETIEKLLALLGDFMCGRDNPAFFEIAKHINRWHPEDALDIIHKVSAKLAQYQTALDKAATVIGIRLAEYNIDPGRTVKDGDTFIYYNDNGMPTGLTRPAIKENLSNLADILYTLTKPLHPLLAFALLGKNLSLFNATGVTERRARRDDLVNVTGIESYRYILLPLLEAIGCENLKPASDYTKDGVYDIEGLMHDLLSSVVGRITALLTSGDGKQVIDGVLGIVPDLLYFVNSNALGVSLQNMIAQITAILDFYNDYAGKTGDERLTLTGMIKRFTGLDVNLETVSLSEVLSLIFIPQSKNGQFDPCVLHLSDFAKCLLDNFTVGKIYYNTASVCDFDTYRMTYINSQDKAATLTILASLALDLLEDPDNTRFWDALLGENVRRTLINVLNLKDFKFDYQDPSWLFTEYSDTDHLVSALTLSKLFDVDPYAGKLWTRKMAAELVENFESFVNDMLYLLGLEIGGIKITDLRSLMHALIGGLLFSNDMMNRLTGLLGEIKPLLDKYDPDGAIAGFIQRLVGVDLHAWDAYAKGGIYENGRDWGFSDDITEAAVDANGAVFEKALVELLSPVAPAMAWMLAESDYTMLAEGDGLGKNTEPIQLTLPGAEGYKYALVPLFEALNIDGSPKNLTQNLRDGDICDPAVYTANVKNDVSFAVEGVVHPLVAMLQKLMDSTATQLLELVPSIVYFINSNGIDTVVKNLIHSVLIMANAAEPMKEQISQLVYDEQGFDLYRTLNLEKLVKEKLYTLIGVTEDDVKEIYQQCGGTWKAVDGLEDIDFRLLFSVALAAINNFLAGLGLPFKFTSIAALAVNELTHGYVRPFNSLTGKTAYTMVLDKTIDKYCLGDLFSIIMRIVLKFLAVDGNVDALMALIQSKAEIHGVGAAAVASFLYLLAGYMGSLGSFEVAMLSIYYTVYGASQASGSGVEAYDHVNGELKEVVDHLTTIDNDIARAVLQTLIKAADDNIGDIIGSKGLAGNGLIRFFKQIYELLVKIFRFFYQLFHK
ncbi:MAG: heterocycloanthracin/sonorensin family bacteriocin [Clostridia bacterium]|nr:heterocycloanthracin/sonorensin family bacteriocin [Clostridia bacterium]